MTQRSRFYDSSGGDRIYGSEAWAQVLGLIINDGIVQSFANLMAVSESSPAAMSVRVNTGACFVQGYMLEVYTGQETLTIDANGAGNPRYDRIVVRRSLAGRTGLLAVLKGNPAASPTIPALTTNVAGEYEFGLAHVLVAAGAASIVNANITDERTYASGPGLVAALSTTTGHHHTGSDSRVVAHSDTSGKTATDHHAAPVAGPDADATIDTAGAAGTASSFARSGHGHKVSTVDAPSGAVTAIDAAATAAAAGAIARAAHGHRVNSTAGPGGDITTDAAGAAGSTGALARATHGHRLVTTAGPGGDDNIDAAGDAGTAGYVARASHGHKLVTTAGPGGDVTVDAAGAAGSTGAVARATHGHKVSTYSSTPEANGTGAAGTSGQAPSRGNHVHDGYGPNSAGGGAAGRKIWQGTTDPGGAAAEGDIWING